MTKYSEPLGVEKPFLGIDEKPFKGFTGKIPVKAAQTQLPEDKNPLTYWCKFKSWVTAGGTTYIENTPGKIFWINHIFLSINTGGGAAHQVIIYDKNSGSSNLTYINIGDAVHIDMDFSVPLKFEDMVRVTDSGGGAGDVVVCQMVGYVQNRA